MNLTPIKEWAQGSLFENLVKFQDLSAWLKIPEKTLRDWVYKRQIPFIKVGKHIRFDPSEIKAWLEKENNHAP